MNIPEEICKLCKGKGLTFRARWDTCPSLAAELVFGPCAECSPIDCAMVAMKGCNQCRQTGIITHEGKIYCCDCTESGTGEPLIALGKFAAMDNDLLIERFGDYRLKRLLQQRTLNDLIEVADRLPVKPFEPGWFFNRHGDMIEVHWSNEAYVAEWVNPKLTLLKSCENPDKIVGVHITKLGTTQKG